MQAALVGSGMDCEVEGCEDEATFRLHVPWDDDPIVCAGHARVKARQDGVVADPLDSADDELPRGASHRGDGGGGDGQGDGEGDGQGDGEGDGEGDRTGDA